MSNVKKLWTLSARKRMKVADALPILKADPKLEEVHKCFAFLYEEYLVLYEIAQSSLSNAAWERSDMKKWADKQRDDPDND